MGQPVEDLEIFNEKADVLLESSFMEKINKGQSGVSINFNGGKGATHQFFGPVGESVSAALFTLRMFIQNNDRISISNIGKIYEEQHSLSELLPEYKKIQTNLNLQLDRQGIIDFFGKTYSLREALDIYLYSTGHTDVHKTKELKSIIEAPIIGDIFKETVNQAIVLIAKAVNIIKNLNRKAIQVLSS